MIFDALKRYPPFMIWTPKRIGAKVKKIPVDPKSLIAINPHDPSVWMSYDEVMVVSAATGLGISFILADSDPFWCIDIDDCLVDGQWNEVATFLMEHFAGCGVELSQSGEGLHIIGTGVVPPHGCKCKSLNIEMYHTVRVISLGTSQIGDAAYDATKLLPAVVNHYFPFAPDVNISDVWTTEHDPGSQPIEDDDELIAKACKTKSAAAVFGGRVTFKELWQGDVDAIAGTYPPKNKEDPYDLSSADIALCQHLAFWTGKNCDRMEYLFNKSAIVRDKWTDREKYRQITILKAVNNCKSMYGSRLASAERITAPIKATDTIGLGLTIVEFATFPEYFKRHYYLTKRGRVFCPDGEVRKQAEYNSMYGNSEFARLHGGKPYTDAWKAYVTNPEVKRLEAYDTGYFPEAEFGLICKYGGRDLVNEYINMDGERIPGDATPFINHLNIILPNGNDATMLLSWVAALIQYPGKKFLYSPFIQGAEGNGKSIVVTVIEYTIGFEHVHDINPEDFCKSGGKFNKFVKNNRLGVLQEIEVGNRKQADAALKRIITSERPEMQGKGDDQITIKTCINIMISSNVKGALPYQELSRRYLPLFCAQQTVEDLRKADMHRDGGKYFSKLMHWFEKENGFAITAHFLDNYAIPDEFNPALVDKAPMTTASSEAIEESRSPMHQAVLEAITSEEPGTLGGWASTIVVKKILKDNGYNQVTSKTLSCLLKQCDYVQHPALLNRGRATKKIASEGGRPVIFVKVGSIPYGIKDPKIVMESYIKTQGYDVAQRIFN